MNLPAPLRWLAPVSVAGTLALTLVAGACSSNDSKVSQDKWVTDICAGAKTFANAQDSAIAPLNKITDSTAKADQKKAFQGVVTSMQSATKDFRSSFDKAGTPDVDHGADIRKAFADTFDANQKALDAAKKNVDALDANASTFDDDVVKALGDDPTKGFEGKLKTVTGGQAVVDAINKDTDCAKVFFEGDAASAPASPPAAASGTPRAQTTVKPNATVNEKWVTGLCVAATGFERDLQALSANVDLNNTSDTKSIKDRMVRFLQDAQTRTRQFKTDIDKLGNPDVKDGKAIQAAMSAAAGKVVGVFDAAASDVAKLDATDPAKLAQGLQALGASLDSASTDVGDAFDQIDVKYDTTALTKIGQDIPECAGLLN